MISGVHLHLVLNHWPIIVTMLGLLVVAVAVARDSDGLTRVALALLAGGGLAALPTYLTGEPAEHAVEKLPGVVEAMIEAHQDAALAAAIVVGVVGACALWALWRYRETLLPRWVARGALAGALVGSALMGYTGLLGGQIRHTEVRPDATTAALPRLAPVVAEAARLGAAPARGGAR